MAQVNSILTQGLRLASGLQGASATLSRGGICFVREPTAARSLADFSSFAATQNRFYHSRRAACVSRTDAVDPEDIDATAYNVLQDPVTALFAGQGGYTMGFAVTHCSNSGDVKLGPMPQGHHDDDGDSPPLSATSMQEESTIETTRLQQASSQSHTPELHMTGEELGAMLSKMKEQETDVWGTTQESAAEIARRIVDNNAGSEDDSHASEDAVAQQDDITIPLTDISNHVKAMDEVFELLASVPWLDDEDVDGRELKGFAEVGLLGTLEEMGYNLRDVLKLIWKGERRTDVLLDGADARAQAAIVSILYHTHLLEKKYGGKSV